MAKTTKYKFDKSTTFGVDIPELWLKNYSALVNEEDGTQRRKNMLEVLLLDHTTGKNIVWGTDGYGYSSKTEIQIDQICEDGNLFVEKNVRIRPRVAKAKEEQRQRTKDKAEVFTPSWVCNKQNNLIDDAWFGRKNVFNTEIDTEDGHSWETKGIVEVSQKELNAYISDPRLEITCGEAPYLVNRYDTTTGVMKPLRERIGFLDRKMRLINQEEAARLLSKTAAEPDSSKHKRILWDIQSEWSKMVRKAYMSLYGYEWQGDNLLLAREAMLYSYIEYYRDMWHQDPTAESVYTIADIISWNLWQMDGLTGNVPYTKLPCRIRKWNLKKELIEEFPYVELLNND